MNAASNSIKLIWQTSLEQVTHVRNWQIQVIAPDHAAQREFQLLLSAPDLGNLGLQHSFVQTISIELMFWNEDRFAYVQRIDHHRLNDLLATFDSFGDDVGHGVFGLILFGLSEDLAIFEILW